jgi:hypothetical protein
LVSSEEDDDAPLSTVTPIQNKGKKKQIPPSSVENTSPNSLFSATESSSDDNLPLAESRSTQVKAATTESSGKEGRPQLPKLDTTGPSKPSATSSVVPVPRLTPQTVRKLDSPVAASLSSGLATKARLAERATTLVNPKDQANARKRMPSFKKVSTGGASKASTPPILTPVEVVLNSSPAIDQAMDEGEDDIGVEAPPVIRPHISSNPRLEEAAQWLNENMDGIMSANPS